MRGVAPRAGIYSYNLLGGLIDADIIDAMVRNRVITAVSSNDWEPEDVLVLQGLQQVGKKEWKQV